MYWNGNPARLKKQFVDLLLVRWIFGRQIGHKNYEDFEHPTRRGTDRLLAMGGCVATARRHSLLSLPRLL